MLAAFFQTSYCSHTNGVELPQMSSSAATRPPPTASGTAIGGSSSSGSNAAAAGPSTASSTSSATSTKPASSSSQPPSTSSHSDSKRQPETENDEEKKESDLEGGNETEKQVEIYVQKISSSHARPRRPTQLHIDEASSSRRTVGSPVNGIYEPLRQSVGHPLAGALNAS